MMRHRWTEFGMNHRCRPTVTDLSTGGPDWKKKKCISENGAITVMSLSCSCLQLHECGWGDLPPRAAV